MIRRTLIGVVTAVALLTSVAAAQSVPTTITGPGGATTLPPNGSQATPASYGGSADAGNDFTASPKLGPQERLGEPRNRTVHYLVGDEIAPPIIYNASAAGNKGLNGRSYTGRAVFEIPVGTASDIYVGAEGRRYVYPTTAGLVTGIGRTGRGFAPSTTAIDYDGDVRAGVKLIGPRIYAAASYLIRGTSLGEPRQRGLGYGIEKLADVDQNFSIHGSVFYYPNVGGDYRTTFAPGRNDDSYRVIRYLIGASIAPNHSPLFLDAGFLGDKSRVRTDAPVGFNHQGPYLGLGVHF